MLTERQEGVRGEGRRTCEGGEEGIGEAVGQVAVSSTGTGPHATEVDVGAGDQPQLRMHGVSGTGLRIRVNRPETKRPQCGRP